MINIICTSLLALGLLIIVAIGVFLIYRKVVSSKIFKEHQITTQKGIDQELVLEIGGIKQYLYLRGEDTNNPIILFLHGGPGGSMIPMLYTYQYGWESNYTVVNWDQRNTGKTYFLNKDNTEEVLSTLSADRIVEDIHEIVIYLTKRFHKEKIIIMGHSWGTVIGSLFVQRYPDLTKAYIGLAQVVDLNDGIALMAAEIRKLAFAQNATKDVETIDNLVNSLNRCLSITEKAVMNIYKVAKKYLTYNLDGLIFFKAGILSPYFSLKHLTYFPKMEALQAPLSEYITKHDLREICTEYEVPVIYIMGEYDLHLKYLLEEYYPTIKAPFKNLLYIKNAGHVVMMDQPDEFCNVLSRVLQESNRNIMSI